MKELKEFTVERLERLIRNANGVQSPTHFELSPDDIAALAKIALAAKQANSVGYIAEVSGNRVGCLRCLPMPDVGSLIYTTPPLNHTEQDGWTSSDAANAALVMLDRIETIDPVDDDRIEGIKSIIHQLAAAPKPESE